MNKKRLLKLADMLEADAKNKNGIKFAYWATAKIDNPEEPVSCGTRACAIGLAAISGSFKRAGLNYRLPTNGSSEITFTWRNRAINFDEAVVRLFDISQSAADFLFMPGNTKEIAGASAEREVAKLIRDFVAGKIGPDART